MAFFYANLLVILGKAKDFSGVGLKHDILSNGPEIPSKLGMTALYRGLSFYGRKKRRLISNATSRQKIVAQTGAAAVERITPEIRKLPTRIAVISRSFDF